MNAIPGKIRDRLFLPSAALMLVISAFLHFWRLGDMPAGIHIDESSTAYNAYCIAETGKDEHGIAHPVFFKAFGDYKNPVMIYVLVPVIKVFGMAKVAIRSPSAIFHILASIALFFLAYRFSRDRWVSLGAAFVFSLLPWIFPVSRIILCGFTPMLFFMILGWLMLMRAFARKCFIAAASAGLFFALAMYSTHSGRPVTAVMLICFVCAYNFLIVRRWKLFAAFVISYVVFLVPMIVSVLGRPEALTNRFNAISVWNDSPGALECILRMITRYFEYFGPSFLFISGDLNITHNTAASGELYIFLLPFIIAGLYVLLKHSRRNPHYRFILLCLLTYPAAAVFTIGHGHSTCCINGTIFWMLVAVLGASFMLSRRKRFKLIMLLAVLLSFYEIPYYMWNYFEKYRDACRPIFNAGAVEVIDYALSELGGGQTLYISKFVFFPEEMGKDFKPEFYANLLFLSKLAPETYQKSGLPTEKIELYDGKIMNPGLLVRLDSIAVLDEKGQWVPVKGYEKIPEKAELLKKFPTPSGINFEVYKVGK